VNSVVTVVSRKIYTNRAWVEAIESHTQLQWLLGSPDTNLIGLDSEHAAQTGECKERG
jgi:hypothetical protein